MRAYVSAKGFVDEVGAMVVLTGKTLVAAVRPPYTYGNEFVQPVPVRAAAGLVPDDGHLGRVQLRARRDPGGATSSTCSARSTGSAACSCWS